MAAINSKIMTATLLSYLTASKDLWSRKRTRYSCKRCRDFEEYSVWKGQATKEEKCKKSSTFLALKQFI